MFGVKLTTFIGHCALFSSILAVAATDLFATTHRIVLASDEPIAFAKCWEYRTTPDTSKLPSADNATIYFVRSDNHVEAIDLAGATRLWSIELGGEIVSNLVSVDGLVYVVTATVVADSKVERKLTLRSLSRQTGVPSWTREIASASRTTLGAVNGTIVSVNQLGTIEAFSRADGLPLWTKRLETEITTPPDFRATDVTVGTIKKEIVRVSAPDGQTRIVATLDQLPTSILSDSDARSFVGDERGNLLALTGSETRWRFKNGARISYVVGYDSEMLAASVDNFVYKLSRGGNVEWKRRLSGRIASRPLIVGTLGIFSVIGDGNVFALDLTNGKIANRIEIGDENTAGVSATGRDGEFVVSSPVGLTLYSNQKCSTK